MDKNKRTWLTVQEVAKELVKSPQAVRYQLHLGAFPNAFQIGRGWRIPKTDVEAYIKQEIRESKQKMRAKVK